MTIQTQPSNPVTRVLPRWDSVLAVVAHPDDESFGLGAVLDAFARAGAQVSVMSLTHGEASTLQGVAGDLRALRAAELRGAATVLGLASTTVVDHPDGNLASVSPDLLAAEVRREVRRSGARGLLVFDLTGVTGHPDHVAATQAARAAADELDLPVLGWTIPLAVAELLNDELGTAFVGQGTEAIDLVFPVDRDRQRIASLAHASQAVPTSVLLRRLELLGDVEHLRWLRPQAG